MSVVEYVSDWFTASAYGGVLDNLEFGFIHNNRGFSELNMPGAENTEPYALNDIGTTGGLYANGDGWVAGFGNFSDHFHIISLEVNGVSNRNQIAGLDFDEQTGKFFGVVATLRRVSIDK
jgi:hypothetical protein